MNAPTRHKNGKVSVTSRHPGKLPRCGSGRTLLPALIALGGGSLLAAGPAAALQLGELRVQSSLGQPLRASIAYALNPNEYVQGHCIRLGGSRTASGLPGIRGARISVGENLIRLSGRMPVNDPLVAFTVNVDCPGTARISREYTAFIDPAGTAEPAAPEAAAASAEPARRTATPPARAATTSARAPSPVRRPVAAGTYRVQPGDSLSGIAARIADRRMGLWDTVDVLFAANPGAFIDGNRDLLLAGSELVIPAAVLEPGSSEPVLARAAPSAAPAAASEAAPVQPPQPAPAAATADAPASLAGTMPERAAAESAAPTAQPRQGNVSLDADGPFVSPIESEAVSPPAETAASTPKPAITVPPAVPRPPFSASGDEARSRSWLMWLGGSGAALILALVLFGRQLKERFGAAAPSVYGRRGVESDDTTVIARTELDASSLDVDIDDEGNLGDSGDIDLAQEFGYTMAGHTSGELRGVEDPFGSTAILESEILPSDDTGEYDLSMIVDATQQAPDAEDTTRDLRAIQLDENEDSDGEYTLDRDVDYRILEQDYQDELTATQALNAELARAAREMTLEIEVDDKSSLPADTGDDTLGATAVLPEDARNASASTVEMRPGGDQAEAEPAAEDEREDTRADEDLTGTMGDAENDPTAETDETKKLRAS